MKTWQQWLCDHDLILVKHQIGTKMAVWTTLCQKCKLLEDTVMPVAAWCEARKPEDLFGNPH
jgi:hypothetical protein